jgi:hypothetical protein
MLTVKKVVVGGDIKKNEKTGSISYTHFKNEIGPQRVSLSPTHSRGSE